MIRRGEKLTDLFMIGETHLMAMTTKTVEEDFKISVLGLLVTGQWFAENADKKSNPLLILTSGVLHDVSHQPHQTTS
jgi:hypothetical protein